jgi:hypothetical protein
MDRYKTRLMASAASLLLFAAILLLAPQTLSAASKFSWDSQKSRVTADIEDGELLPVLEEVAQVTSWQVFVEPDASQKISAKFNDLAPGEALRMLLGSLNFALVPSEKEMKLYVFRTSRLNATRQVRPRTESRGPKLIANEVIVRLKPGANIDEIAKALGAKVVGRLDKFGLYRLRFEDIESADAARAALASNPDVESIDNNYAIDRPGGGNVSSAATPTPPKLRLNPPPNGCKVIVGLIDTGVQSLGPELDPFLMKQVSVAGESALDPSVPSHGTSMAGTLLASLADASNGSTGVRILPVDVYGRNPVTSTFQVAEGIVQAVNGGANVINMSLGSEGSAPYIADLIAEASRRNITIIGAAGNQPVKTPYYPAALPGVLAVTATENGQIAPYASRGDFVSLAAPGTSVIFYKDTPYQVVGTSAAAAYSSGVAAAHREANCADSLDTGRFLMDQFAPPPFQ